VSLGGEHRRVSVDLGLDRARTRRVASDGAARVRRARVERALVALAGERGFAAVSVGAVVARAGISRRTFYSLYGGLEGCLIAVLDDGFARVRGLARAALARSDPGAAGLRAALAELLSLLDDEAALARVWLLESRSAGPRVLAHRERRMAELRDALAAGVLPAREPRGAPPVAGATLMAPANGAPRAPAANGGSPLRPAGAACASWAAGLAGPPLAVEGTFAAVLGIIETHLRERRPGTLLELLGPLMGLVVAPYLGLEAARREAELGGVLAARLASERVAGGVGAGNGAARDAARDGPAPDAAAAAGAAPALVLPGMLANPSAHRARGCVLYLAAHPGASNSEIAHGIGVRGKEQISKLLARLADQQLVAKSSHGKGLANAWRLTDQGERAVGVLAGVAQVNGEGPRPPAGGPPVAVSGGME
jgi:AcrR family transcriptional regulator